ncbi:hypothetical protein K0T92_23855, partial [Paenibacillus oenotherae]
MHEFRLQDAINDTMPAIMHEFGKKSAVKAEILQRVSLPIESGNSLYTDSRRSSGPRLFMNKSGVSERALYV